MHDYEDGNIRDEEAMGVWETMAEAAPETQKDDGGGEGNCAGQ